MSPVLVLRDLSQPSRPGDRQTNRRTRAGSAPPSSSTGREKRDAHVGPEGVGSRGPAGHRLPPCLSHTPLSRLLLAVRTDAAVGWAACRWSQTISDRSLQLPQDFDVTRGADGYKALPLGQYPGLFLRLVDTPCSCYCKSQMRVYEYIC